MNWIILIIAGLCEVGFTFCLGKAKDATGWLYWEWMGGFLAFTIASMWVLAKATQTLSIGTAYPVLHHHIDCLHWRVENGIARLY